VLGTVTVRDDLPVLVERIVVARMRVAADVPFVPSGRHAVAFWHVAVQVLADHRGTVAGVLQPGGDRRLLEPEKAELLVSAPRRLVADDVGVVGVLAPENRGARG